MPHSIDQQLITLLREKADAQDICTITTGEIIIALNSNHRTIIRTINLLCEKGWIDFIACIEKVGPCDYKNRYRIK